MPLARKRFGQHFLERAWAGKLVAAIAPQPAETLLEIGPGRGALTFPLASAARQVICFEIDRDLAGELKTLAPPNVTVVEGDFLNATPRHVHEELRKAGADGGPVRVVGNLPYNIASPILFKLVELYEGGVPISDAIVMVQREVADRLIAQPGSRDYGVLTVLMRRHARIDPVFRLPPGAFRPAPKVDSTVVRMQFHPADPPVRNAEAFTALTQAVFTRRRKMLSNALLAYEPARGKLTIKLLEQAGISPKRRPETLDLGELAHLSDLLDHDQ